MTTALGHCPHRHPRNGEKLIHIRVVELIITAAFRRHLRRSEKNITHHYRWCVIHDFLPRVRGVGKSAGVFNFVRVPRLPVFSNRVVDFNTVNSAYPVGASFNMRERSTAFWRTGWTRFRVALGSWRSWPQGICDVAWHWVSQAARVQPVRWD